ncbi:gene transfer agent protein [Thioclava dalianensis]|uniref:Gene transfer agent protein n=1 Tax=Thioclava dalianensis TaxID=1185766 RepID=A0A074TRV0_9RHOB|nr:hypothetical protein [Thioclava dalianensis]KEP71673.1 gene transfer agent protein [Thioclava dalianensis]SFN41393.1 phage conserved hypothetical protein, phiE125 gp8 family [Thioclava dalianensis]
MMLTEESAVASGVLPLAEFRDHLRLGTGFEDLGALDAGLEAYLRAALAAIEGRTAKVLLSRAFTLRLAHWRTGGVALPVAPVVSIDALRVLDPYGVATEVAPERYRLVPDLQRPRLEGRGGPLPAIASGGAAEIAFTGGFGPVWADLPVDLAQAVFLLAAQYFELRHDGAGAQAEMSFGVLALIERWRTVRMLGGGA